MNEAAAAQLERLQGSGDDGIVHLTAPIGGKRWMATRFWMALASEFDELLRESGDADDPLEPGAFEVTESALVPLPVEEEVLDWHIERLIEGGFGACTVPLVPADDNGSQRTVRFKNRQCPVFESAAGEVVVVDERNARAAGLNLDRQLFARPNGLLLVAHSAGDVTAVAMALNIVVPGFTRLGESEPAVG